MKSPREVPNKDEKYMGLAFFHSFFSKDPNTQIGAVVVDLDGIVVGTGYNGPPALFNDNNIDWSRPNKYKYIKHAEENALDRILIRKNNLTLYVTGKPCPKCILKIIDYKIMNVIYFNSIKINKDVNSMLNTSDLTTEDLAEETGINLIEFNGNLNYMFENINNLSKLGLFNINKIL
jgi:dCMP deaminase